MQVHITGNSYPTVLKVTLLVTADASQRFSLDRVLAAIGAQTSKLPFLNQVSHLSDDT